MPNPATPAPKDWRPTLEAVERELAEAESYVARLTAARDALRPLARTHTVAADAAPYGYKADGTPRKRPAPSPRTVARQRATKRARAAAKAAPAPADPDPAPPTSLRVSTLAPRAEERDALAASGAAYVTSGGAQG